MSLSNNFPVSRPTLLLDFANTKQLDSRITFTRASTATYYDGKTAALAEQNLLTYSQQFDNAAWTKLNSASVTANSTAAPDGTTTADTVTDNSTSLYMGLQQFYPAINGTVYTGSIYVKRTSTSPGFFPLFQVATYQQSTWCGLIINTTNGTVAVVSGGGYVAPTAYSIVAVGDYFRVTLTVTSSYTGSNGFEFYPAASQNGTSISAAATGSTVFWGAQLEQRSSVSDYTATTTAPITNYIPALQTIASGVPRFDSNPVTNDSLGLLIEEQRTNLITASRQFETPVWVATNATIAANIDTAPDGSFTADKFIENTSNSVHTLYFTNSVTSGTTYTYSVFAKAAERSFIALQLFAEGRYAFFDLATGTVGTVGGSPLATSMQAVGNGWYRCSISATCNSSGIVASLIYVAVADTIATYTGNGYAGIYIWGAQFEVGASPTSYIPTTVTFTSRASSATFLGPNGYITSAGTNVARNQTNSVGGTNLLLEGAASNLLQYTDDFANSYWSKTDCTASPNQVQAPDGLVFADKLVENIGTVTPRFERAITVTVGVPITFSVYLKAGERSSVRLYASTSTYALAWFNLSNGTIGTTDQNPAATITAVGGGWYRCSITYTPATTSGLVQILMGNPAETPTYTGNGASGVYVWGAQVETGSTATSYIPSTETFSSRGSSATFYNSSGVLNTASSGVARTTYNPALLGAGGKLLLEPAGSNLMLYSEQFDNAAWTKVNASISANATTAPDGNTTADKLVEASGPNLFPLATQTITVTSGTVYTLTVYAKAAERSLLRLLTDASVGGGSSLFAYFDLNNGTIPSQSAGLIASIQPINNGWYRLSITRTAPTTGLYCQYLMAIDTSGNSYTGNGTSGLFMWGAQLEAGAGATSYIATTASSVTRSADASTSATGSRSADVYSASTATRAADVASMTGANFSSWYRQNEGTIYWEATGYADGAYEVFDIDDGSNANRIRTRFSSAWQSDQLLASNSYGSIDSGNVTVNSYAKYAVAYKVNDVGGSLNAGLGTNTLFYPLTVTTARIGGNWAGSEVLNGTIKKIAYYPKRLSNTEIQALTS